MPIQLPSRIQEGMQPAATFSLELAGLDSLSGELVQLGDINIYTFILERSACSVKHPCALSALELVSAISPPLGLVSSRVLRAAIALSREGLARVRTRPCRGRRAALARWQGRVSAVSHTRPNHSSVSLQRPVCWGPPTVPWSRSPFFVSGSRRS